MTFVAFSEILRNLALAVAAGIGSWFAWRRLYPASAQAEASVDQAALARRSHARTLFRDAAGDLGSDGLEVRLAAILVLGELSRDHPELTDASLQIVSAYVRRRNTTFDPKEPPQDVAAAIGLIQQGTDPDAQR